MDQFRCDRRSHPHMVGDCWQHHSAGAYLNYGEHLDRTFVHSHDVSFAAVMNSHVRCPLSFVLNASRREVMIMPSLHRSLTWSTSNCNIMAFEHFRPPGWVSPY